MDRKVIDKKIKNLIKKAGSDDLEDIISYLGIKVIKQASKSFYCQIAGKKYIYLDKEAPEDLQPFILGLEIDPAYNYTISQYATMLKVNEEAISYIVD